MGMRGRKIAAYFFGTAAGLLVILAIVCVICFREAPARILQFSQEAEQTVNKVMQSICAGDYETASKYMAGNPDLGVDRSAADPGAGMIWDAFVDSLSYELQGSSFAEDDRICQNVIIRSLEIDSITENLQQRTQQLLTARVEAAEDSSVFYDENDEYREDFVQEAVFDAIEQAIREDARYQEHELTIMLSYRDESWWVMLDQPLLQVISGGMAG